MNGPPHWTLGVWLNHTSREAAPYCRRASDQTAVSVVNCDALTVCVPQVEVLYGDEPLKDYYTLMDIAYFYEWRRVSDTLRTTFTLPLISCTANAVALCVSAPK